MAHIDKRKTNRGDWRYDVRYRGPDGKERSRTFNTRKAADVFAATVRSDLLRGTWVDPQRATRSFDAVSREWLGANADKRPSALARDESIVRVHLTPEIGQRPIGSIKPEDVRALVQGWRKDLAPRTVKRMYGVLRAILNFAVDREMIVVTPCRGIALPKASPLSRHVIAPSELAKLVAALGEDYGSMAYLGAVLGLRWGEVAGLRVRDVRFLEGRLSIEQQVTRGKGGRTVVGPPKSDAGRRTLTVPQPLLDLLSGLLETHGITAAEPDALFFAAPEGGSLDYAHWRRRVWQPACIASGLGELVRDPKTKKQHYVGLTFHDLRRANATALVLDGVDLKTAQTRLGHSDPRLTLGVYAQATSEADKAAAERLGERFFGTAAG